MRYLLFSLIVLIYGCSLFKKSGGDDIPNEKVKYRYQDGSGEFRLVKEIKRGEQNKVVLIKTELLPLSEQKNELLENSLSIAKMGTLNVGGKKVPILSPEISQYTVWLDGQKYFSQLQMDPKTRKIKVVALNPQTKHYERSQVTLPEGNHINCFYSQLIECIRFTGFLGEAIQKKTGTMRLNVLWDPYPFLLDQYENVENSVFTPATFSYDGETEDGLLSFALSFGEQFIFYQVDNQKELVKKLWTAQGITQEKEGFLEKGVNSND